MNSNEIVQFDKPNFLFEFVILRNHEVFNGFVTVVQTSRAHEYEKSRNRYFTLSVGARGDGSALFHLRFPKF